MIVLRAAAVAAIGVWVVFFLGCALRVGCQTLRLKPPILLFRCWMFSLFLAVISCLGLPAVQMAREAAV